MIQLSQPSWRLAIAQVAAFLAALGVFSPSHVLLHERRVEALARRVLVLLTNVGCSRSCSLDGIQAALPL